MVPETSCRYVDHILVIRLACVSKVRCSLVLPPFIDKWSLFRATLISLPASRGISGGRSSMLATYLETHKMG